jgi:DNA-binding beta-propeller fold protein YncE
LPLTWSIPIICAGAASAGEPVIVEAGWVLARIIEFEGHPKGAHHNPIDCRIYTVRDEEPQGLFRIEHDGTQTELWSPTSNVRTGSVLVDPSDGDIFISIFEPGSIRRTDFQDLTTTVWVSDFDEWNDTPMGMAIAPPFYTGDVIAPGEGVFVDLGIGRNADDEGYRWSPETPEGELRIFVQGPLVNSPMDITVADDAVYFADGGNGDGIFEVNADRTVTEIGLSEPLGEPRGITWDPVRDDLLVQDTVIGGGDGRIVRVDPETGAVSDVVIGFRMDDGDEWAGVDTDPLGRDLIVTDSAASRIFVFTRAVLADDFSIPFGSHLLGDPSALHHCDDVHVFILARAALTPTLPLIRMDIAGVAPTASAASIDVTIEAYTDALPDQPPQRLSLFVYATGRWEIVDERIATPSASVFTVTIDSEPERFIESGTNDMKMRLEWFHPGDVFFPAWLVGIDQAWWLVTPAP